MGNSGSEGQKTESTEVYRLSLSQVLAAGTFLVLVVGFFLNATRGTNTDISATVERSESKLRGEFQRADDQLRTEIATAEARATKAAADAETRVSRQLGANEARDSKRFENIESQVIQLNKKR